MASCSRITNNSCFFSFTGLSAVSAMSLFSWMKWSNDARVQPQDEATPMKTSGVVASRMLIRELLWHVEEHEQLTRELEQEHRLAHSALGLHWFQKYPKLRTLISTSELHQLEFLCAQIPAIHAATVLSRCLVAAIPRSMLTLVCCQQWLAASASTQGLTAGKAKTQRGWEAGRAAKKAIMCYCHRGRPCRVWTCEGEGCPVRQSQAAGVSTHHLHVSHNGIKKDEVLFYMVEHCDALISHKTHYWVTTVCCLHNLNTKE